MSEQPGWSMDALRSWAREGAEAALKPPAQPSVLEQQQGAAWPLLLEAAVVSSFLPRELAPDVSGKETRQAAESTLLNFADCVHGPEGIRWALKPSVREKILDTALKTGDVKPALERTAGFFQDAVSKAMRGYLSSEPGGWQVASLPLLEAARTAVASLAGVQHIGLPSLEDMDRDIELRRLLSRFEHMIGRRLDPATGEPIDCFYGRGGDLEKLRAYVGVVSADSITQGAQRLLTSTVRVFTGRKPLVVWGVGGVGKTTLVAKFMLEHAEAAASRFPFAFLDFDRATVSARNRLGLLEEMCLQAGSQFAELAVPMRELSLRINRRARKLASFGSGVPGDEIAGFAREFRALIDDHLDRLESLFERARPFLLVFDTFEIVQYSTEDVEGLEEFVRCFGSPDEANDEKTWPRLRLIICGRKNVTQFLGAVDSHALGPLDANGALQLLLGLAAEAQKKLAPADAKRLIVALNRSGGGREVAFQPLRLHLIGGLIKDAEEPRAFVDSLIDDLKREQPGASGALMRALIDGILVRRILGHVADARVRALANPGLVVRRINRDVIEKVMTRATLKPCALSPAASIEYDDSPVTEPWSVSSAEAKEIFEAFGREVSLVERDGPDLRHRPDVRLQMLPLIRARLPNRTQGLHRLAYEHFRGLAVQNLQDHASAAEAIYHGLWLSEPLTEIDSLWPDLSSFQPRLDCAEFDGDSEARIYIDAKAGARLKVREIERLPPRVALQWLHRRGAALLKDRRIEEAIDVIRSAAGHEYAALDGHTEIAGVVARVLYRAGYWDEAAALAKRHCFGSWTGDRVRLEGETSRDSPDVHLSEIISTWATVTAKCGGPGHELEDLHKLAHRIPNPMTRIEVGALVGLGLAQARHGGVPGELVHFVRSCLPQIDPILWAKHRRVLRLVMIATGETDNLLPVWVASHFGLPRDLDPAMVGEFLLEILRPEHGAEDSVEKVGEAIEDDSRKRAFQDFDAVWRLHNHVFEKAARERREFNERFRMLITFDHSDWERTMGNALNRALRSDTGRNLSEYLADAGLWEDRFFQNRRSGMAVLQRAVEAHGILRLASALVAFRPQRSEAPDLPGRSYPSDVYAIAGALLRCHATIEQTFLRPA